MLHILHDCICMHVTQICFRIIDSKNSTTCFILEWDEGVDLLEYVEIKGMQQLAYLFRLYGDLLVFVELEKLMYI